MKNKRKIQIIIENYKEYTIKYNKYKENKIL